ncbi:hypothetical protein GCM10029976_090370 [Kribbella albertanoniae]|uniref:Uncharacterized protein n=1 Tax=Kribbella albertanoniae TaxID=1266829 RepID=A0A4R4PKG6_9ACTN|nr:hypothetical protein [Kribbella albertanoniae]TDC22486.1 hypothetical protein E1261_30720 [Kribbella albertanoniae]
MADLLKWCPNCHMPMTHEHRWDGMVDEDVLQAADLEWQRAKYKLSDNWLSCNHCGFEMPDDRDCGGGVFLIANPFGPRS